MLLQRRSNLEQLLVTALAAQPNRTVKQLVTELSGKNHHYSLRGIYKELGRLESEDIVFKTKQTYSLRLSWVINLIAFADTAYERYTSPSYLADLIQASDGKIVHRFANLRKLDLCWIQAMLALHKLYPQKPMCLWIPYQWFHLVHDFAIRQFYGALDITGERRFHIFGMDCYLSRLAEQNLPKKCRYSFAASDFEQPRNVYYSFIGNHLITVRLDQGTTKRIDSLFRSVKSAPDAKGDEIAAVFASRCKATLTIEESEGKVKRLRKSFSEFFGETIE